MDVFIPIHFACHVLSQSDDKRYCPVLGDLPLDNPMDEQFLYLNTAMDGVDFDLQIGRDGGLVLTEPALHHAKRLYDDNTLTKAEDYAQRGDEIAKSLHFGSSIEYLAAWMNEDKKQAELIHDIDAVLSLNLLKKLPHWARHDLFLTLEAEAMKHIFAERFLKHWDKNEFQIPATLRDPIHDNANHATHPILNHLMTRLFQTPLYYDGCGQKFTEESAERMAAFHSV